MDLGAPVESERLVSIIKRDSRKLRVDELRFLLETASKWKPSGYDSRIDGVRTRYEGKQETFVRKVLKEQFPETHAQMPCIPLNLMRLIVRQDQGIYPLPAQRWMTGEDDERLPREGNADDEKRAKRFAKMLERSQVDMVFPEVERRALAARCALVYAKVDQARSASALQVYWTSGVHIVPDPEAPHDLQRSLAILLSCVGPSGVQGERWFNVWSRVDLHEGDDKALHGEGRWRSEVVSMDGAMNERLAPAPTEYAGTLFPGAMLRLGIPEGGPFPDEGHDLTTVIDNVNAQRSNEAYVLNLQGHTQITASGFSPDAKKLVIGPDALLEGGPDVVWGTLNFDPKLSDMRAGRSLIMRELATVNSNDPQAYIGSDATQSGTARRIARIPHEQARGENIEFARVFEQEILAVLVEQHDLFLFPNEPIGFDGIGFGMQPTDEPEVMDPEVRQRMAIEAHDAGLIDKAQTAVDAGKYRTKADAEKALELLHGTPDEQDEGAFRAALGAKTAKPEADDAPETKPASDAPAAPITPAPAGPDVQKTALNGAQVTSLVEVIKSITAKEIPRETGVEVLVLAFQIEKADAERLVGKAGAGFVPDAPATAPPPFAPKPTAEG